MRDMRFSEYCHDLALEEEEQVRVKHLRQLRKAATVIGNAPPPAQLKRAIEKTRRLIAQAPAFEFGLGLFISDDIHASTQTMNVLKFYLEGVKKHRMAASLDEGKVRLSGVAMVEVLDAEICRVEVGYRSSRGAL